MKIPCVRCGKEIDSPDSSNADYLALVASKDGTIIICPECFEPEDKPRLIWGVHKK